MIEDGTVAVLFWLLALGSAALDREDGLFEMEGRQAFGTVGIAAPEIEGDSFGTELRVSYYPGVAYGPLRPVLDVSANTEGLGFAGAGFALQKDFDLGPLPLYAGMEFVPGVWIGDRPDELGGAFTVRSGVELGVHLDGLNGARVSVMADHRSNANIYSENAGMETIGLRLHMPF
ncbi:acyloxyacyl hydrolase [Halovulum sp. GXIMD14794]